MSLKEQSFTKLRVSMGLFFLISSFQKWTCLCKILLLTEFETQISGIGGDRSANCATTTAHKF